MNLWAGATKASPQSTVGHTSARPDLKSQVGHSKHAQGNSQEQPRVHGGQGGTCRNLAPHHKKDLVGGQPRNSSEWSQVTQGAHGHTGDEAQGTQLSPIQHLPAVYPDQLQAYQSFPASAEHTGIHPEASPKGPQQAPGKPHLTLTQPPVCQNMRHMLATYRTLLYKANPSKQESKLFQLTESSTESHTKLVDRRIHSKKQNKKKERKTEKTLNETAV